LADPPASDATLALLKATLDAAQDGIVAVGVDGRILAHNRQYLRLFNLDDGDLLRGALSDCTGIVDAASRVIENLDEVRAKSRDARATPDRESTDIVRLRNGRVYERFLSPLRLGGVPAGVVASFSDVTRADQARAQQSVFVEKLLEDVRALEDQLRQSQKMEAIGRLAGGIAHDLNNALTAIAGYSELAIGQLPSGHPARADVEEVRRGAERAGSVTRQLLAFSRKEVLEPRLFDLNQTISALGRLLSRLLGTDVEVQIDLAPAVPPIMGDPGQLEQAIINLALNARDAMPSGGRLVLSTRIEDPDEATARANPPLTPGRYIVLRVSDTGQGMSRETLSHIFEPFFTTKAPGKGTGLGLSMVYGTLKQIGGFIFADSELGRGTTFRLYFRPAAAPAPSVPAGSVDAVDDQARRTVLVVEDEPAIRTLVASALRADGYRLLIAGSAEEALRLADDHHQAIDLLVTDAIMPGKTGIELARLLSAKRPGLQVIVMTAYRLDAVAGLDEGMTLLQKPFGPAELRDRVRDALVHIRENSR
jgi:signal transduction histidine kinase/CheY-like chemotaxis protein